MRGSRAVSNKHNWVDTLLILIIGLLLAASIPVVFLIFAIEYSGLAN
jgi:hypothetical protein